jgi:tetratricopeptide (TPR) repeat protein
MELLHDYFDLIEPKADDSAAFLLTRAVPDVVLEQAASAHRLPIENRIRLLDAAIGRMPEAARRHVALAKACMLGTEAGHEAMREALDAAARYPPDPSERPAAWATNYGDMRRLMEDLSCGIAAAWSSLRAGEGEKALRIADRFLFGDPRHYEALVLRAHTLRVLGRLEEAQLVVRDGLDAHPGRCEMWMEKTWLHAAAEDFAAAVAAGQQAVAMATATPAMRAAALDALAYALSLHGRHEEAVATGAEALAVLPGVGWLLEHHAFVLVRAGRRADAVAAARMAVACEPNSPSARQVLEDVAD